MYNLARVCVRACVRACLFACACVVWEKCLRIHLWMDYCVETRDSVSMRARAYAHVREREVFAEDERMETRCTQSDYAVLCGTEVKVLFEGPFG